MNNLLIVLVFAAILAFWWDSLGAREVARGAGRHACEKQDYQFLDESVSLSRIRLRRDVTGRMRFYREYQFEFSPSGDDRRMGMVTLLGRRVQKVELDWYEV